MKYFFSLVAIAAFSFVSSAQWTVMEGQAVTYDTGRQSLVGVDYIDGYYAIVFNSVKVPILNTGGDYRFIVDGKYRTLSGIGAGGSWVCMDALDSDVRPMINSLRNGSALTVQVCAYGHCETIHRTVLSGSNSAIKQATPLR